jgi:hypothetical protein
MKHAPLLVLFADLLPVEAKRSMICSSLVRMVSVLMPIIAHDLCCCLRRSISQHCAVDGHCVVLVQCSPYTPLVPG